MRRALLLTSSLLAFATSTFATELVKIHGIITHPLAESLTVLCANGNLDMRGEPVTALLTADLVRAKRKPSPPPSKKR